MADPPLVRVIRAIPPRSLRILCLRANLGRGTTLQRVLIAAFDNISVISARALHAVNNPTGYRSSADVAVWRLVKIDDHGRVVTRAAGVWGRCQRRGLSLRYV